MSFEMLFDLQAAGYRPSEALSILVMLPVVIGAAFGARAMLPDDARAKAALILVSAFAGLVCFMVTISLIHEWRTHSEISRAFSHNDYRIIEGPITAMTTTRTAKGLVRTRLKVDGVTFQFGERGNEQGLKETDLHRLRLAEGHYVRIAHYGPTILRLERRRP